MRVIYLLVLFCWPSTASNATCDSNDPLCASQKSSGAAPMLLQVVTKSQSLIQKSIRGDSRQKEALAPNDTAEIPLYTLKQMASDSWPQKERSSKVWSAQLHKQPLLVNGTSVNSVPITDEMFPVEDKDVFAPFGRSDLGTVAELHMPHVTLHQLHSNSKGSLARFLVQLRGQLSLAAEIDERRITILEIKGRYKRVPNADAINLNDIGSELGFVQDPGRQEEEVIVKLEIVPGGAGEEEPKKVMEKIGRLLSQKQSILMKGPLHSTLLDASLQPIRSAVTPISDEREGMARLSSMALPIGISAAFTGILIWLAA